MAMNIMTYLWNKKGKPDRIIDKLAITMSKLGLYKARDYWTIEDDATNNKVGAIYTIEGSKLITSFLSWASNCRNKGNAVNVRVDSTGKITSIEDES